MNTVRNSIGILLLVILFAAATSYAAQGDDILGVWNNEEKDGKIEIYKCDGKYCGKIVWAKEPNYPAGSTEGAPGTPRLITTTPMPRKGPGPFSVFRL
jgi:uncharacterized protein (DUF2147 family)